MRAKIIPTTANDIAELASVRTCSVAIGCLWNTVTLQRQATVCKNPHCRSSGTSSTMDTSELTSCDRVYAWVQRASALLGWWRKTHNVELTLAKARIYNDTDAFDISKMIAVEEKFLALLKRRVGILADALAVEENWDEGTGHLGNDMMKKIALKISAHAKDRARGGERLRCRVKWQRHAY